MDFQKMMVIFILIFVPISVVLSTYIRNQVDTIQLQADYKEKLINSTYDAINAYEMNTMSPDIAVGEGNKRYVLASVNTFFNSLATNLGVSGSNKTELQAYVPAILFTNYDGYYIYSPTKMPKVATNSKGVRIRNGDSSNEVYYIKSGTNSDSSVVDTDPNNDEKIADINDVASDVKNAKIEYENILKPYVYYSATYHKDSAYDIVVNYSLDNYVSIYGSINGGNPFTKSGYLIDYNNIDISGNIYMETYSGSGRTL